MTAPEDEIRALEPIFHRSPSGSTREVFEAMTDGEFFEVGASGARYTREFVLDEVARRYAEREPEAPLEVSDYLARPLGGGTWLATYRLDQAGRISRRATLWRVAPEGWVAMYHQGTLVERGDSSA